MERAPGAKLGTYAEHHIIPHSLLEAFWKVAAPRKDEDAKWRMIELAGEFMGGWETVRVSELKDSNRIKDEWLNDDAVKKVLGGGYEALQGELAESVFSAENLAALAGIKGSEGARCLVRSLPATKVNWGIVKGEAERDEDTESGDILNMTAGYYEWMPGNLVVGPEGAIRANDPKDNFDEEAARALDPAHAALLSSAYADMLAAVGGSKGKVATVVASLSEIAATYNTKTRPPDSSWTWTDRGYEYSG